MPLRVQNEFAHDDRTWKERLQNAILSIPLTLTAELGKPKTSLGKLLKSAEEMCFSMPNSEHVVVKIAGESVFHADIGKVGPNAAISMKKRISGNGEKNGLNEEIENTKEKDVGIENPKVLENIDVELTVEVVGVRKLQFVICLD